MLMLGLRCNKRPGKRPIRVKTSDLALEVLSYCSGEVYWTLYVADRPSRRMFYSHYQYSDRREKVALKVL